MPRGWKCGRTAPIPQAIVTPGLALDADGREIILLEEARVQVIGTNTGQLDGNYLFIQYREEMRAEESENFALPHGQTATGGPSRVRATPILGWSDIFPHESSGKIVLAQLELNADCTVRTVQSYPRRYIGPASAAKKCANMPWKGTAY